MSLLSTNIAKVKRLSIKEAKLPAPEVKEPESKPIQIIQKPPTAEEIAYSKLGAINPLLEELVNRLDLVGKRGLEVRRVEVKENHKPYLEPEAKTEHPGDSSKLIALAQKIIKGEDSYTKEEIVARIAEATKVNQERAEKGFILMLKAGAIEQTINPELYYLEGSSPF